MDKISVMVKKSILFWIILILGLAVRIIWIAAINTQPVSDFLYYHNGAISILQGKGFRVFGYISAYEPIGYPAFLTILYFIFGKTILAAKIANVILSAGTLVIVYKFTQKCLSQRAALPAMLIMAFFPRNIIYTSVLSTEILFTFLFFLVNYLLLLKLRGMKYNIAIGLLLGVLALLKPYMMIFQFVILAITFFEDFRLRDALKQFAVITVVMAVTICPWTIRNYLVFHEFIPISTNGGYNLYINNNPYAIGSWQDPFKFPDSPILKYKHPNDKFWDEVQVDKLGKKLAYDWIKSHPVQFVKVGIKKVYKTFVGCNDLFWSANNLPEGQSFKYYAGFSLAITAIHFAMLFMGLVYCFMVLADWVRNKKLKYMHKIIIFNFLFYFSIIFVFEGQPRYIFPLFPFFIVMAVHAASKLFKYAGLTRGTGKPSV